MLKRATALLCVLQLTSLCRADALIMDDGTRVEGKIHKQDGQWIVIDAAGKETDVDPDRVKTFILGGGGATPQSAEQRLASLRASAQVLTDVHIIIDRYKQFIKDNAITSAGDDAKADLAQWQQRLDDGSVKVGARWLTAAERDQMAGDEAATVQRIEEMVQQGRDQDAIDAVMQALKDDPENPSALFLQGVNLFNRNKIPDAKTAFEKSDKSLPGRWSTLNNLAIVGWRQNLFGVAMNDYALAMTANPMNETVLDNVCEAMNLLTPADQKTPPVVKCAAIFARQDADLAKKKQADGQVRWGATWVNADQLPKLQQEEAADNAKLAAFLDEVRQTQSALQDAESRIQSDQQAMGQMGSPVQDPNYAANGGFRNNIQIADYQQYQQMQQEVALYTAEAKQAREHLVEIQNQMARVPRTLTVPRFTGLQRFIGSEGTPIRPASTTQPDEIK